MDHVHLVGAPALGPSIGPGARHDPVGALFVEAEDAIVGRLALACRDMVMIRFPAGKTKRSRVSDSCTSRPVALITPLATTVIGADQTVLPSVKSCLAAAARCPLHRWSPSPRDPLLSGRIPRRSARARAAARHSHRLSTPARGRDRAVPGAWKGDLVSASRSTAMATWSNATAVRGASRPPEGRGRARSPMH